MRFDDQNASALTPARRGSDDDLDILTQRGQGAYSSLRDCPNVCLFKHTVRRSFPACFVYTK